MENNSNSYYRINRLCTKGQLATGAIMTFDFFLKFYYIIYTKDYGAMSDKRNGNNFSVC